MFKKLIGIAAVAIMLFGIFGLTGCTKKASKYTEAEHIQRVTERIEKRFMTSEYEYTGFEVYPLYNEDDELKYLLVKFTPQKYVYVSIRDEKLGRSMYLLSDTHDETPYSSTESESEKRYLLHLRLDSAGSMFYIAATRIDEKFINLISMKEVEIIDGKLTKEQVEVEVVFVGKKQFDL